MKLIAQQGILDLHQHDDGRFTLTDGWKTDMVIFYDHKPAWSCDGIFFINRADCPPKILKALDDEAVRHFEQQQSFNEGV